MKLYVVDPISIGLLILLFGYGAADMFKGFQDRRAIMDLVKENSRQADHLVTLAGNAQQGAEVIQKLVIKQAEEEKKYQGLLADKDAKTGEQFGILAAQAKTISQTTPASDTISHYKWASDFLAQAKGTIADAGLAWNTAYIKKNLADMNELQRQLEEEKRERQAAQERLLAEAERNEQLARALVTKTQEHAQTAKQVVAVEGELAKEVGIFETVKKTIKWSLIIGGLLGILYVGFHVYQVVSLKRRVLAEEARRREANQQMYAHKDTVDEMKTLIKTFMAVGPEGNAQMAALLKANGLKKHFEDVLADGSKPTDPA